MIGETISTKAFIWQLWSISLVHLQELCRNNFGNFDSRCYSGIILEFPVHYPTKGLLRRLGLVKQGVTILTIT